MICVRSIMCFLLAIITSQLICHPELRDFYKRDFPLSIVLSGFTSLPRVFIPAREHLIKNMIKNRHNPYANKLLPKRQQEIKDALQSKKTKQNIDFVDKSFDQGTQFHYEERENDLQLEFPQLNKFIDAATKHRLRNPETRTLPKDVLDMLSEKREVTKFEELIGLIALYENEQEIRDAEISTNSKFFDQSADLGDSKRGADEDDDYTKNNDRFIIPGLPVDGDYPGF